MNRILGLTGTPGTGKKTVAPRVADELRVDCVNLNDIARDHGLLGSGKREGEVDTRELGRWVARDLRAPALAYGHLFPYVFEPKAVERVVVLRCEPAVLKKRLVARGYPPGKVTENLEAELIGALSAVAFDRFGAAKTAEVDTSGSAPRSTAEEVAAILRGSAAPPPRLDWTVRYDSGAKLRSLLSGGG